MKGPIRWRGGKFRQAPTLVSLFPEHTTYVEPFTGGARIIFQKKKCLCEVINDLDGNLMNFWRVCRDDHEALIRSFDYALTSREVFEEYQRKYKANDFANPLERAHIFYYLNQAGFGADMKDLSFGRCKGKKPVFAPDRIEDTINSAYDRLKNVTIENQDFVPLMRFYDTPNTFFYLDPPYRGDRKYCVGLFEDERYRELAEICKELKGKFLLTINDDEFMRDTFKDFNVDTYETYYSVCRRDSGRHQFSELIITNYDARKEAI